MGRGRPTRTPSLSSVQSAGGRRGRAVHVSDSSRAKLKAATKKAGFAEVPTDLKKLRACMICSLIKTDYEFDDEGCDNCDSFLQLAGTRGSVHGYTSANFEGMIGMISPEESWVAKWQRIIQKKPGVYAINVYGEIEGWVKRELDYAGVTYVSRDKTKKAQKPTEEEEDDEEDPRHRRPKRRQTRKKKDSATSDSISRKRNDTESDSEDNEPRPGPSSAIRAAQDDNIISAAEHSSSDEQDVVAVGNVEPALDEGFQVTIDIKEEPKDMSDDDDSQTVVRESVVASPKVKLPKEKKVPAPPESSASISGKGYSSESSEDDQSSG